MSEPDGIDEVVDGSLRQSLMAASRLAETLARMRQESLRQREQQDTQAAHEAQVREAAQRAAVQGALAPVQKDQWWDQAQPKDIAQVYALAEGWKDHDSTALAAADRIRYQVYHRYGIDTRDVGADAAYLEQLPWGHITVLLDKAETPEQRTWYASAAVEYGWSRNVLLNMMMNKSMERTGAAPSNIVQQLVAQDSELANSWPRIPTTSNSSASPAKSPNATLKMPWSRITETLRELGPGFAFVGRQVHFAPEPSVSPRSTPSGAAAGPSGS